jgi:hypothetical protein
VFGLTPRIGIFSFTTFLGKRVKKHSRGNLETACKVAYEARVFSYTAVEQELVFLQTKTAAHNVESLPAHANIRGAEYYQERNSS